MRSPIVKDIYFSDLDTMFTQSPSNDDVLTITNLESIKRSVRNIVSTNKGERMLDPEFGSHVRSFLFEPDSDIIRYAIQEEIFIQLENFEPRIEVTSVAVENTSESIDNYELLVTIEFTPINSQSTVSLNLVLERAR
jgi:phage baseplate assembly protein W